MKSPYSAFLSRLLIYSAILGAIMALLYLVLPKSWLSPVLPFLLFFFIAATMLSYAFISGSMNQRFMRFVNTYLLTTLVKLVLYVTIMVIYVFFNRDDAVPFMLGFFTLYLCYTVFEVIVIVGATKKTSGHPAHE